MSGFLHCADLRILIMIGRDTKITFTAGSEETSSFLRHELVDISSRSIPRRTRREKKRDSGT
jgi:hypothetical protein